MNHGLTSVKHYPSLTQKEQRDSRTSMEQKKKKRGDLDNSKVLLVELSNIS